MGRFTKVYRIGLVLEQKTTMPSTMAHTNTLAFPATLRLRVRSKMINDALGEEEDIESEQTDTTSIAMVLYTCLHGMPNHNS